MIYVFVIFFILELIVTFTVCVLISLADRKVISIAEKFNVNRHTLKFRLRAIYDVANTFKSQILKQKRAFIKRRKEFIRTVVQGALITILFFFFKKTKLKNKFLLFQSLLVLYDTIRADCAV